MPYAFREYLQSLDGRIITGPPNGPVLFCSLASVVCRRRLLASYVTLPAGGQAGRRARGWSGGWHYTAGQYGYVPLGRHLVVIVSNTQWYTRLSLPTVDDWRKMTSRRKVGRVRMPNDVIKHSGFMSFSIIIISGSSYSGNGAVLRVGRLIDGRACLPTERAGELISTVLCALDRSRYRRCGRSATETQQNDFLFRSFRFVVALLRHLSPSLFVIFLFLLKPAVSRCRGNDDKH